MGLWVDDGRLLLVVVLEVDVSVSVQQVVWDVVVATCMKGTVLRMETLEVGVWAAVAVEMVAQTSRWKECRRLVQWRLDWA